MALFIRVDGEKILSYGKNGDIEITSWPEDPDSLGDPARKSDCYWNGSIVQLKDTPRIVAEYAEIKISEARELLYTRWPDSSKTVTAAKNQYSTTRSGIESAITVEEIDIEYNDFVTWLDLS